SRTTVRRSHGVVRGRLRRVLQLRSPPENGGGLMTSIHVGDTGVICPAPVQPGDRVQLGHGSGGKLAAQLLRDRFLPHLRNPVLEQLGDAAVVTLGGTALAMSTDTFV